MYSKLQTASCGRHDDVVRVAMTPGGTTNRSVKALARARRLALFMQTFQFVKKVNPKVFSNLTNFLQSVLKATFFSTTKIVKVEQQILYKNRFHDKVPN